MILEIARITVKPGMEAEFEDGVRKAVAIFSGAKGCRAMNLRRSVETPSQYLLFVQWETIENHTEDFRGSDSFAQWRGLIGHCMDGETQVEHSTLEVEGFES